MLLHLPIAILATLSPITVSDMVPKFDIARECRFEAVTSADFAKCTQDEAAAVQQLRTEWSQFAEADTKSCTIEASINGIGSYVELLTCLEMAEQADKIPDRDLLRGTTGSAVRDR